MIKSKSSIFYIDQQSYGNLSVYDYSLLSRIDRSVEIHYFCNRLYDAEMLEHNIHYHKIFRYSGKQGLAKKVSYTLSVLKLLLFIILYAPKVIHQQWIKATFLDLIIWKISKRFFNTKIIYTAHNVLPHIGTIKSNDEYKKVYSVCDVIISHTLTSQKELAATFPETENKIQIIPHGVLDFNISQSEINDAKSVILQQYDLKGKLILGMFGFQSLYKGSDIILKLWSECPELSANDNLRLLVIGKSEQDILPASLPSNVIVVDRYVANE
ncbi:MAG: glycosyltransferase [Prevotellaceae bacterium]|nr:glycosyltransferase [Prevotellaceae bacterium]